MIPHLGGTTTPLLRLLTPPPPPPRHEQELQPAQAPTWQSRAPPSAPAATQLMAHSRSCCGLQIFFILLKYFCVNII